RQRARRRLRADGARDAGGGGGFGRAIARPAQGLVLVPPPIPVQPQRGGLQHDERETRVRSRQNRGQPTLGTRRQLAERKHARGDEQRDRGERADDRLRDAEIVTGSGKNDRDEDRQEPQQQ